MASLPASSRRLGRYRILGHLASGGMAEILLAKLEGPGGFQKLVVLKRVLPELASKAEYRRMFADEARIVASLNHPNIVQVSELAHEGDDLFLAMEYLEGESLQHLLKRTQDTGRQLDYSFAAYVLAAACAGLHAAHEHAASDGTPQNIVHRDVSPHNLFITYDGVVKVIDFGVAKSADRYSHTSAGELKGKFSYMSPEQCQSEPVDRRADVFALGIVLWEATAGRRLFKRENELLVFHAICEEPIPRPSSLRADYPPALEHIVMRALAQNRDDRYDTAAEMRLDLLTVLSDCGASRTIEDALAAEMTRLFGDRIAQRQELARQISAGKPAGSLEWIDGSTGDKPDPASSGLRAAMPPATPSDVPDSTSLSGLHAPARANSRGAGWRAAQIVLGGLVLAAVGLAVWPANRPERVVREVLPSPPVDAATSRPGSAGFAGDAPASAPIVAPSALGDAPVVPSLPQVSVALADNGHRARSRRGHTEDAAPRAVAGATSSPESPANAPVDVDALNSEALSAYVRGRFPQARVLYLRATVAAPRDAAAWRGLGLVAARLGQRRDAKRAFQRYLALAPDAPDAARIRGQLEQLEQLEGATPR